MLKPACQTRQNLLCVYRRTPLTFLCALSILFLMRTRCRLVNTLFETETHSPVLPAVSTLLSMTQGFKWHPRPSNLSRTETAYTWGRHFHQYQSGQQREKVFRLRRKPVQANQAPGSFPTSGTKRFQTGQTTDGSQPEPGC